jgi:hypothetical protein
MKAIYRILSFTALGILNLSFVGHSRPGLLTGNFGIVTVADLDEEESRCNDIRPFPYEHLCFNYWQCLPTQDVQMYCEDIGGNDEFVHVGEAFLTVKVKDQTHQYFTRRNFDMETCKEWMNEWSGVLGGENVVCLSGQYSGIDKENRHHLWQIDRMKSRRGEWSYFAREDESDEVPKPAQAPTEGEIFHSEPKIDQLVALRHRHLLTPDDLRLEIEGRLKEPALSSSPNNAEQWSSYNRWLCFAGTDVTVDRIEMVYDNKKKSMVQLSVALLQHFFEISLSAETDYDNDKIATDWRSLLAGTDSVCAFAAFLQGDSHSSLWTISRLKTMRGYWVENQ